MDANTTVKGGYVMLAVSGEQTDEGKSTFLRHCAIPGFQRMLGLERGISEPGKPRISYAVFEKKKSVIFEGEDARFEPEEAKPFGTLILRNAALGGITVGDIGGGPVFDAFSDEMALRANFAQRIDRWVMPVRADINVQKPERVIDHIGKLFLRGVSPEKFSVIFNQAGSTDCAATLLADDWKLLDEHAAEYGYQIVSRAIPTSEVISLMRKVMDDNVVSLALGSRDYAQESMDCFARGDYEAGAIAAAKDDLKQQAQQLAVTLDAIFQEVVTGLPVATAAV